MTAIAVAAAILAGCFLAITGLLQQRAASTRPEDESLSPRLLLSLARNRVWLLGLAAGFASYGFQAIALAFGALALVQPIFLSELLFAVPISVRLHGMKLHAREWCGVLAVFCGLGIGIVSADPRGGHPLPPLAQWGIVIGSVAVVVAVALAVSRRIEGPARASAFAAAGACVMALQSSLLKSTVALFKQDVVSVFTHWQGYALIPVTVAGILLIQTAYQAGPLAASMPVMDAVIPCVAIAIGVTLFREQIDTGALRLAGTVVGLVSFLTGIVLLDTSPVVQRLQREEDDEGEGTGAGADVGQLRRDIGAAT